MDALKRAAPRATPVDAKSRKNVSDAATAIEAVLVEQRPFCDSTYIAERRELAYRHRLSDISTSLSGAESLGRAVERHHGIGRDRVMADTMVRLAIDHAHAQMATPIAEALPPSECEGILAGAAKFLEESDARSWPGSRVHRLGTAPYHGWLWDESLPDDVAARTFRRIVKRNFNAPLSTLTDDERSSLCAGERLLQDVLPSLGPSALGHTQRVAFFVEEGFWRSKASSSEFRIGGTIFLSRSLLHNPWWVAEHLLHESLHQKLYDFRHGHSLLEPASSSNPVRKVRSLWNQEELTDANLWDVHRTIAAFHVYVHLGLFSMVADERAPDLEATYGARSGTTARTALERAQYLGEQLKSVCWADLGLAGKALVEWLCSVLEELDPSPAPKGTYAHLVLDRHRRDTTTVADRLEDAAEATDLRPHLNTLAREEVEQARTVLAAMHDQDDLERFDRAIARYDDDLGTAYVEVRRLVEKTLRAATPDGYDLGSRARVSLDLNDLVRQMVESSSHRLHLLLRNIPPVVAAATQRASRSKFRMSCDERVGRLLAMLAGAVRLGGSILEIGTGVGVGTAWIAAGLRDRTDVRVLSLEVDSQVSDVARRWAWPGHVEIRTVDAMTVLPHCEAFDLVFADASPLKYQALATVLRTVRPGGILLVDDIESVPNSSDTARAERAALRRGLLKDPRFQAVELDWASGVIMATNCEQQS